MRRSLRAVLLAYFVASAGCAPAAVQTAEPVHYIHSVVLPPAAASSSPSSILSSSPADSLSVIVSGPTTVPQASTVRFTATVSNGTAQRYYYWWFAAACTRGAGCASSSYLPVAEGEGRSEVDLPFEAEHQEKDLVVQAAEIDGRGRTGSSPEYMVAGPARRRGGSGNVDGGASSYTVR
jgi:hypothetical protein